MVRETKVSRYLYHCSMERLLKRPLVLQIWTIIDEAQKPWCKKREVIKKGREVYRDWPKDPVTVFRALKTMTSHGLLEEKRQGRGQASGWRIKGKKRITIQDVLIYEIHQMEQRVNEIPDWTFDFPVIKKELESIWEKMRTVNEDVEEFYLNAAWANYNLLEKDLFSMPLVSELEKQLCIVFLFLLMHSPRKELPPWFVYDRIPFMVNADLEMTKLFRSIFYPGKTSEEVFNMLQGHVLDIDASKMLRLLACIYLKKIVPLQHQYRGPLTEEESNLIVINQESEQFKDLTKNEGEMNLSFLFHKKRKYSWNQIRQFIDNYRGYLTDSNSSS